MSLLSDLTPYLAPQLLANVTPILAGVEQQAAAYATQLAQANAEREALKKAAADAIAALAKGQSLFAQVFPFNKTGAELSQALSNATDGQTFVIGSSYTLPPTTIKANGVRLIGLPGASIAFAPIGSTGFEVTGTNFEVCGLKLTGPVVNGAPIAVAFHLKQGAPGFYLHDCIGSQLQQLVNLDTGANGAQIANVTMMDLTAGDTIFCSADNLLVQGLIVTGSMGEHVIRFDKGAGNHRPQNARIIGCSLANKNGKEVIACREIDGVTVQGGSIDGWFGEGQSGGDLLIHSSRVRLLDVFFAGRINGAQDQAQHDVDLYCSNCSFAGYADVPAITIDDRGKVVIDRCIQRIPADVDPKTVKPLAKGSGTIVGIETVTQVVVA